MFFITTRGRHLLRHGPTNITHGKSADYRDYDHHLAPVYHIMRETMKISCICMDENVRDSLAHFDRCYTEIYAVGCTGKLTTVIIHRPSQVQEG